METPKLLIVDDDKSVLTSLLILFRHHGFEPIIESDPQKIHTLLKSHHVEAVVLDMNFRRGYNEGKEGIYWLDTIKQIQPDLHVILITAYGEIDLAVEAVKRGATDFILKPWDNDTLVSKVQKAVDAKKQPKATRPFVSRIVGVSEATLEVKSLIRKVAESPVSVLITGERGSGKELVSREIHSLYEQGKAAFHRIDCATISSSDLWSKLSDSTAQVIVFRNLDMLPLDLEMSFLQLLETRKGIKFITLMEDKNMLKEVNKEISAFLSLIEIHIEPLRSRKKDIAPLVDYFMGEFAERYERHCVTLSEDAEAKVMRHQWPGNVAELSHCIERAVILSDSDTIAVDLIKIDSDQEIKKTVSSGTLNLSELEKEAILKAIEDSNGNITKASEKLGITRTALYRRMEKYDI